ncbi:MAG: DUF1624 domain-containing protein [Flavisolibacter sp.]|nr:DUF1624 domain-containing protein [Flavisolibacter sp.]
MPRLLSIDLAKGFTVLFIPAIHVIMLYSNNDVHDSIFSLPFRFIAEWPGAQLLMFLMGMGFSFSKRPASHRIKRATMILITGYLLNLLKFLWLYWLGWLPVNLVTDLKFSHSGSTALNLFLIGDILQFAAIALFIMMVIKRFRYHAAIAISIAYLIVVASPLAWDWHHSNIVIDHWLHLVGGRTPDAFFPLVPWLMYPLIGLAIGSYFQSPLSSVKPIACSGAFLLIAGYGMQLLPLHFPNTLFWRTYPDKTIMHLGFVMFWVSLWFWMEPHAKKYSKNYFVRMLSFCSRHITAIYLLQWMVIFWMLPLFGYHNLGIVETMTTIPFIYFIVFIPVYIYHKFGLRK